MSLLLLIESWTERTCQGEKLRSYNSRQLIWLFAFNACLSVSLDFIIYIKSEATKCFLTFVGDKNRHPLLVVFMYLNIRWAMANVGQGCYWDLYLPRERIESHVFFIRDSYVTFLRTHNWIIWRRTWNLSWAFKYWISCFQDYHMSSMRILILWSRWQGHKAETDTSGI